MEAQCKTPRDTALETARYCQNLLSQNEAQFKVSMKEVVDEQNLMRAKVAIEPDKVAQFSAKTEYVRFKIFEAISQMERKHKFLAEHLALLERQIAQMSPLADEMFGEL